VVAIAGACGAAGPAAAAAPDLARYVNPFNGTQPGAADYGTGGGAGNTFPGPFTPFGMMQFSPDTSPGSKNSGGGYAYNDRKIRGFSVRRLSGAGCANGGDFPFLPTTLPVTGSPVEQLSTSFADRFLPSFARSAEAASPGYYRVDLDPGTPRQIGVRMTATARSGVADVSFPAGAARNILINATGSRTGASAGSITIDPVQHEVSGSVATGGFCMEPSHYRIFFTARFSRPFAAYGTWTGQQLTPGSQSATDVSAGNPLGLLESGPLGLVPTGVNTFTGLALGGVMPTAQTGGYLTFPAGADRNVEVRIGMSFVSVDGARRNLDAESGSRSFSTIRKTTRSAWNRMLARIVVHGGRVADRRTFYSMLYHALGSPTTFNDVDGRYMGFDDTVHDAGARTQYADFSGWDVYRSQMPLLALIAPRQASDIAASLLADQRQSGWLPKWSVANTHTEVMTGDPADPTLAAIWALGARGFDARQALAAMVKGATASSATGSGGYVERAAVAQYQSLGYVPDELSSNYLLTGIDFWRRALLAPLPGGTDLA
jgi:predicted alpha-1,2-mannosidase